MFGVQIPATGLDQRTEVADCPGGQACGRERPWSFVGRELRGVAGREVGQVRAAERRLRQEIRRRSVFGPYQDVQPPLEIQRQLPDDRESQRVGGPRPAGFFEEAGGPGSGGYRICGRAHREAAGIKPAFSTPGMSRWRPLWVRTEKPVWAASWPMRTHRG